MADARLRTAEAELLGLHRVGDVDGWEIPGRYLGFLRGGPAEPLAEVVRHNDQDVRSLGLAARASSRRGYGDRRGARRTAPAGDLAGLARAFARERRLDEALDCLDAAVGPADRRAARRRRGAAPPAPVATVARGSTRTAPTTSRGGRPGDRRTSAGAPARRAGASVRRGRPPFAAPWTTERIAVDRAHLLRRLGRYDDAVDAWSALAAGPGRTAVVAAIELAKIREHRLRDPAGCAGGRAPRSRHDRAPASARTAGARARGGPPCAASRACGSDRRCRRPAGRGAPTAGQPGRRGPTWP